MVSILLFLTSLFLYFITLAPSITTVDTPEFVAAAHTFGIPHAPGYSLYMLIGHVATHLPIGDNAAFRMNLLSAVALACAVVLLYHTLLRFVGNRWIAASSALIFGSSYYVWSVGLIAEVYALQLLVLAICLRLAVTLWHRPEPRYAILLGAVFGVAVAIHPASALFAPAMIGLYVALRIPWRVRFLSGGLAFLIFAASLIYFPLRYDANPPINTAGVFNEQGEFEAVDLSTADGIIWLVSGQQFQGMFFERDINSEPLAWLVGNFLGIGVVMGLFGLYEWWEKRRGLFVIWLIACGTYSLFYATYGADDRQTMFGAVYLLWIIPLTVGFQDVLKPFHQRVQIISLILLPLVFMGVNFSRVNLSDDNRMLNYAETLIVQLPEDAAVFGHWKDIMPLHYLQVVEETREDLDLYNLFLFEHDADRITSAVDYLLDQGTTIVFLSNSTPPGYETETFLIQIDPFTQEPAVHQLIR